MLYRNLCIAGLGVVMRDQSAEQGQESPEDEFRQANHEAPRSEPVDISSEPLEYFPDHLADFYQLLKADYEDMRRTNHIIFYETRVIIWLCVIAALVVAFRASLMGGSLVSIATLAIGLIGKLIKVRDGAREEMENRLEELRLTTLEIERICLRVRFARAISDREQRNEVLEELARDEPAHQPEHLQAPPPYLPPLPRRTHDSAQHPHRRSRES
jgi:hypothetical protein